MKTFLIGFISIFFLITPFSLVRAESFGGTILTLIYCDCNDVYYYNVSDPVPAELIRTSSTHEYDCSPTALGEWILGLHLDYTMPCLVTCDDGCCLVATGYVIDFYGSSDYYDCNESGVVEDFDNLGIEGGNSNSSGDGNNDSSRDREDGSSSIPGTPIGGTSNTSSISSAGNSGDSSSIANNTEAGSGELDETGLDGGTIAIVTEENEEMIISENDGEGDQTGTGERQSLQSPEAVESFRENLRTILATAGVITVGTAGAVAFVIIRRRS